MRKLALSIALGAAFLASAAGAATKEVRADGFTVQMPGEPQVMRDSVAMPAGNIVTGAWTLNVDGTIYSASYADFPLSVALAQGSERMINEGRDGLARQLKGLVKGEKALTIGGNPGKSYTVTSDNGEVRARNYVVGPRLYTLLVLFNPSLGAGPDADTFLNSLKLDKAAK